MYIYVSIYIYIYIYIYVDVFIYSDSNADISEKSTIRFFCTFFFPKIFGTWKLLKTCVIMLWNIGNYQSIYVKMKFLLKDIIFYNTSLQWKMNEMKISQFSIFFCMLQINGSTFWDLTTWKCVISMHTYVWVKLRYIAAQ